MQVKAVLVAIAIPIFTAQLEKAREATDAANIRSAYAEVVADKIAGEGNVTRTFTLKQQTTKWQNDFDFPANLAPGTTEPTSGTSVTVTATETGASINIVLHPTTN